MNILVNLNDTRNDILKKREIEEEWNNLSTLIAKMSKAMSQHKDDLILNEMSRTDMSNMFMNCSHLTSIPEEFYNQTRTIERI